MMATTASYGRELWSATESAASSLGDFDADGDADGGDFLAWQRGFGTTTGAIATLGDSDGDGDVDTSDVIRWARSFGDHPAMATSVRDNTASNATAESMAQLAAAVDFYFGSEGDGEFFTQSIGTRRTRRGVGVGR